MHEPDRTLKASGFTELYRDHAREVYRFALYLSGDPALAEDIVSEVFLRIWDSAAVVRMETVRGYLFTIARNVFLHDLRRKQKQDPIEDNHSIAATVVTPTIVRELESKKDLRDTLAALQTLPETDRAALHCCCGPKRAFPTRRSRAFWVFRFLRSRSRFIVPV